MIQWPEFETIYHFRPRSGRKKTDNALRFLRDVQPGGKVPAGLRFAVSRWARRSWARRSWARQGSADARANEPTV